MATATAPRRDSRLPLLPPGNALARAALLALLLAAVELLLGALIAPAIAPGRAEALPAILLRPWIAILLVLLVAPSPVRVRTAAYLLFLIAAGASEALQLRLLGNRAPWAEMARGWVAGSLVFALVDIVLQLARRRLGRRGLLAAALTASLLFAIPQVLRPYRAIADPAERPAPAGKRPPLLLMTALPLVWGEGGAFDPNSRPAASYRLLQQEFVVRPIDTLDPEGLAAAKLLLLAQPRWLAPAELVALDAWVRDGGRLLVLTDPVLEWPSELPLGDVRRAPPVGLLKPLLDHWGVGLEPDSRISLSAVEDGRLLTMRRPGRFAVGEGGCRAMRSWLVSCRVGEGRAILIADADLMRDDLWIASGEGGEARSRRLADNPLVVGDLLDALAGVARERTRAPVAWIAPAADAGAALALALLPIGIGTVAIVLARLRRRRATR